MSDDMWDDSALVESWNEALEEYKKYHSILRDGRDAAEIEADLQLKSNHDGEATKAAQHNPAGDRTLQQPSAAGSSKPSFGIAVPPMAKPPVAVIHEPEDRTRHPQQEPSNNAPFHVGGEPLGSIQDDGLKKLLMSWYYAGYYTGLYEGQQQARNGV